MKFESRLKRIEKRLNIKQDDEIVEFMLNDGHVIPITHEALNEIFDDIWKKNPINLNRNRKI